MKEKPSEWIAISDLMAGVMAVMMLLLVLAVMLKGTNELKYQQELAESRALADAQKVDPLKNISENIASIISSSKASNLIEMDMKAARLTLKDGVFEKGSACLTVEAQVAVESVRQQVADFLKDYEHSKILVEGYTDDLPVKHPVTDFRRFCTVYDDNFTLSAARAREARKAIIGDLDEQLARKIIVAGYGDSSPLAGLDPSDARNRRVEVQLVLN